MDARRTSVNKNDPKKLFSAKAADNHTSHNPFHWSIPPICCHKL